VRLQAPIQIMYQKVRENNTHLNKISKYNRIVLHSAVLKIINYGSENLQ
jgi:hypothetical protein